MNCPICDRKVGRTTRLGDQFVCPDCYLDAHPEEVSHTCTECGQRERRGEWIAKVDQELRDCGLCFACHEWINLIGRGGVVVQHGGQRRHFLICEEPPASERIHLLGHGGARFDIQFFDGRQVVSHNVWFQGEIPPHFYDRFPVNAKFGFDARQEVA
jgi:hypothetical protein